MTPPPPANPLVLIVEDEPRLRELLLRAVSDMGFQTAGAHSAEEALRLIERQPADILVLDLNLPGMGGMELLQHIRQRGVGVQAIILTGFGDLEAAKNAIRLDAVDFLTKPCHLGDLEVALDRARKRLPGRVPVDLPALELARSADAAEPQTLEQIERQHILAALDRNNGNRAATAAELGISLRTLYYRLNEYGCRRED